ncbi:hypothetical protein PVK06_027292 [Gossypium arboreum]|uniref:Uncharacterized protein n=1 Tax=Gossypium arboreum TaxID=29729 RepID=A0ABR0NZY7_GOSAR|nr:hypothetical protein PVK06_027292 [Gossypium arboreum]
MDDHAYSKKVTVTCYLNTHVPNISFYSVDGLFLKETYLIHADLGYQDHIFNPRYSFGAQESLVKDSGTNLLEEEGNDASLKAQFHTYEFDGLTLAKGPAKMSKAKKIKSGFNQRPDSRMNPFEERGNDTCTDEVKFIKFQSPNLPIFKLGKLVDLQ